jgi:hypothetical protein
METETWSKLLDSDASSEIISRSMSADFLDFVQREANGFDTGKRAKVLMALLYTSDEKLNEINDPVISFCEACERDEEEWIRIIANIVLRWLKKVPKDRDDYFSQSERRILEVIKTVETSQADSFVLPADVIPTHWPFLAKAALPKSFDIARSESNPHFTIRAPHQPPTVASPPHQVAALPPAQPKAVELPEKIRAAIAENSNLLTEGNRQILHKFFSNFKELGMTDQIDIPISESRVLDPVTGESKMVQLIVQLTPKPSFKFVKKVVVRGPARPQSN